MSIIPFDCSQFISFDIDQFEVDTQQFYDFFEKKGMCVKINSEIDKAKQLYFDDVFKNIVIEIVDKEFLGNFEDWRVKEIIPKTIEYFITVLEEFVAEYSLVRLLVIFVDYASQIASDDIVVRKKIESRNLRKELIYVSPNNFEQYGNIYIFYVETNPNN